MILIFLIGVMRGHRQVMLTIYFLLPGNQIPNRELHLTLLLMFPVDEYFKWQKVEWFRQPMNRLSGLALFLLIMLSASLFLLLEIIMFPMFWKVGEMFFFYPLQLVTQAFLTLAGMQITIYITTQQIWRQWL